jgi:NitT/TauT family transport system ATP-binding protein
MRLTIEDIAVEYDLPRGGKLAALGPASFTIEAGQFVCLVGPSGCGKSTLIRVIAGLESPARGRVLHNTELIAAPDITRPSPHIGLMFQEANLMPWRTVIDNVALPLELAGADRPTRYTKARDLLDGLGLADFTRAYPGSLSGGMAQRVALARVLVNQPEVLLLDEPFGALDAITREQVSYDMLRARRPGRQTVLMVTHDVTEAVRLADRVLVMSQRPGRVIADLAVPIRRPRHPDDAYTPEFVEIARAVRDALGAA